MFLLPCSDVPRGSHWHRLGGSKYFCFWSFWSNDSFTQTDSWRIDQNDWPFPLYQDHLVNLPQPSNEWKWETNKLIITVTSLHGWGLQRYLVYYSWLSILIIKVQCRFVSEISSTTKQVGKAFWNIWITWSIINHIHCWTVWLTSVFVVVAIIEIATTEYLFSLLDIHFQSLILILILS